MPYSDILNSINTFGTSYNYGDYQRVNPYSSGAYINNNVRDFQKTLSAPVDPRSAYSDYKITNEDRALKGLGYMGMGQNVKLPNAAKLTNNLTKGMANVGNAFTSEGSLGALSGTSLKGAKDFDLGNAALVLGLTRDGNPYEMSGLEAAGNVGAGVMTGMKFGGPIGAGVGLLAGLGYNWWKKGDLEKKNEEADIELQEDKDEYDDKINKFMSDNREHAQTLAESELWAQQSAGYDNQYGGHLNSYGSSYYNKGGKLTKKEFSKVKNLGRNGDTQLAHINPQEAAILKQMGGSGTINPYTGLREYSWLSDWTGIDIDLGIDWNPVGEWLVDAGHTIYDSIIPSDRPGLSGIETFYALLNATGTPDDQKTGDYWETANDQIKTAGESGEVYLPAMDEGFGPQSLPQDRWNDKTPDPVYQEAIARNPRAVNKAPRSIEPNKLNIANPFKMSGAKDKKSQSNNLEDYRWNLDNDYIRENVDIFNKGGKLTPKELKKVQSLGRNGDTQLAHINPQEAQMLKAMGGSGTINPYTGLREYSWFGDFLGDLAEFITSPIQLISDTIYGEENILGQFFDNLTFDDTRGNIFGDHTIAGHQFDDQSKTAVYNPETGEYDIQTNQDGVTLGFDPNDSSGLYFNTPGGKGNILGQATEGTPWSYNNQVPYQEAIARDPRAINSKQKPDNPANVTNPFKSFQTGDKENTASNNLEGYRWDMANPYIRENVDIFDDGGVVDTTESLPMDSLLNRQIYKESSFDATAESDAGAVGLTQIMPDTFKFFKDKGWVPEGKKFSDLKTDTALATDLQEKYMTDLLGREWNRGSDQVKRAKALAAYNMGPTKLVNKLNELKKKGVDIYNNIDWINELSTETSDYVNKILLGGDANFEADYTTEYNKTGKNYANGGMVDAIAEFTGNELIINNQNQVELGLKEKDYAKAAAPIKLAMEQGFVTPGPETHQGNPMPVDKDGSIYAGGGSLPFKVRKGAGVYDHATDQFKEGMSDKEIAMVAQKNINKWKSNNMA